MEHYIMQQQQPYNNFLSKNKVLEYLITKGIGKHWSYAQNLFLKLYISTSLSSPINIPNLLCNIYM